MQTPSHWPKPSCVPWSSLVLVVVNLFTAYLLDYMRVDLWWLLPVVLLNGFFFWAERDIYNREKRNYDSWNKEVGYLMGVTDKDGKPLKPRKTASNKQSRFGSRRTNKSVAKANTM